MKRLHVTAEGQTEESFVNNTLKPYLASYGVYADVRRVLTGIIMPCLKTFQDLKSLSL